MICRGGFAPIIKAGMVYKKVLRGAIGTQRYQIGKWDIRTNMIDRYRRTDGRTDKVICLGPLRQKINQESIVTRTYIVAIKWWGRRDGEKEEGNGKWRGKK